jgi:hypothetical protein
VDIYPGDGDLEDPAYIGTPFPSPRRGYDRPSGSGRFTILLTLFLAFGALYALSEDSILWAIVLFALAGASGWLSLVIIRREVRRQVGTWELPSNRR